MKVIDAIALIFTVGYFLLFAALVFHVVPPENREMLNALLGILSVVMLKIVEGYKELLGAKPEPDVAIPPAAPDAKP